jgi:hypothetical protein
MAPSRGHSGEKWSQSDTFRTSKVSDCDHYSLPSGRIVSPAQPSSGRRSPRRADSAVVGRADSGVEGVDEASELVEEVRDVAVYGVEA